MSMCIWWSSMVSLLIGGASARLLFKHMQNNGDTLFGNCDVCYEEVAVMDNYKVFGNDYEDIYVTDRGYLTFGSSFTNIYPTTPYQSAFHGTVLVAPLWGDMDQWSELPNLRPFHIWYRESKVQFDLDMAQDIIQDNFAGCGDLFVPTAVFIVTYQRMPSFCDGDYYDIFCSYKKREAHERNHTTSEEEVVLPKSHCDGPFAQNGFQVALATDGCDTFAIFNYADIEWQFCTQYSLTAINAGDGVRYWSHPDTGKAGLGAALTTGTNANEPGRWVYKISESEIKDPACKNIS